MSKSPPLLFLLTLPLSRVPSPLTPPFPHSSLILVPPHLDYCIVAFFVVLVISTIQWFLDGRKNFKGPKVELVGETHIRAGEVESDSSGARNGEMVEERA